MQFSIFLTAFCASAAMAIMVTQPTNTTVWKDGDANTIKWTSVDTDPGTVDIFLVNNQVNPSIKTKIATNVPTSAGQFVASNLQGVGAGFQINLVSTDPQNSGILAQSNQFTLSDAPVSSSASAASTAITASVASVASTGSAGSTATATATGATTLSTATGVSTPTGGSDATGTSTASASVATQSTSAANMNTISTASLVGLAGLLALVF